MLVQIQESESYLTDFWVDVVKSGRGHLFSPGEPKICCILRMSVNWANFLHADYDAKVFG